MARATWGGTKTEAKLELRNRDDIDTRVETWLWEAYQEIYYGYRFYETEKKVTFTLVNGASEKTIASVAADLKHIFSVRDMTNKKRLDKANFRWIDERDVTSGVPTHYCRFAADLLFDRAANADISYRLRYRKQIVEPVFTGSNFPETPPEWDEAIRLKAVARGYKALHEADMASYYDALALRLIASLPTDEVIEAEDDEFGIGVRMSM